MLGAVTFKDFMKAAMDVSKELVEKSNTGIKLTKNEETLIEFTTKMALILMLEFNKE